MKHLSLSLLSLMIAASPLAALAADGADFVTKASEANKFEIDSSKLALEKSNNAAVKDFARQMVEDHEKAGSNLKTTLPKSHVSPDAVSTKLNAEHAGVMRKLDNATGVTFDHDYIAAQQKAHQEAVALFSGYADKGDDGALKKFATETLPTLKQHKAHVMQLSTR